MKKQRKTPIRLICVVCGNAFERQLYGKNQTCSRVCRNQRIAARRQLQDMSTHVKWHDITCVVCGKSFRVTGQQAINERKTCSKKCEHQFRSSRSAERNMTLPVDVKNAIQQAVIEGVKRSPNVGGFETNIHAKTWRLLSPDNTVYHFRNLALFLRQHTELFDPDDLTPRTIGCRASAKLSRLRPDNKNRRKSWKGWEWDET